MDEYEGKIEWMHYLKIIWKRKWIIIIPAILCAALVGIISALQDPVWEVEAVLEGGDFFDSEQNVEILTIEGEQLAGQINEGYYNSQVAIKSGLSLKDLPRIRAKNLQWAQFVRVTIRENDVDKATNIINSLFNLIKADLDKKIDLKIKSAEAQIVHNTNIVQMEEQAIEGRKEKIGKLQREIAEEKKRLERSNQDYAEIQMLITEKEKQIMTLNNQLERKGKTIEITKSEIDVLKETKANIHPTRFIKKPEPSVEPVGPQTGLNILFSAILGLFIFGLFAFFLEYVEKQKNLS